MNQLDLTKNNSNGVEMPVEKTVEELFDEYAGVMYVGYMETVKNQEKRKKEIISEVKSQVRREVEEELKGLKVYIVNINENYATTFEAKAVYMVDDVAEVLKGINLKEIKN